AMQVEARDRAAGTLSRFAIERDEHRRPARLLDETRGDDTDHARVPALLGEDYPVRLVEVGLVEQLARLDQCRAVDLLPPAIQLIELARNAMRVGFVIGCQELDAAHAFVEPSDCVQSRRENKADAARGDRLAVEARRVDKSAKSRVRALGHEAEAVADENA